MNVRHLGEGCTCTERPRLAVGRVIQSLVMVLGLALGMGIVSSAQACLPGSCVGFCGGNAGPCWCDESCCGFEDCCLDKFEVCGGCDPGCEPACSPCVGDITNNGTVGVPDLLAVLGCWGPTTPDCQCADLTNNGNVGVPDLLVLLGNWGPCPPPPLPPVIQFHQLNWIGDEVCNKPPIFASKVGSATLTLDAGDPDHHQLLAANGGGFVNITFATDLGEGWVVQNLYLAYPSEQHLHGGGTSVHFRLPGIEHGQVVNWGVYGYAITAEPLFEPEFPFVGDILVQGLEYHVGGRVDPESGMIGGSGCSDIPELIGNWIGGDPGEWWVSVPAWINDNPDGTPWTPPAIAEKKNECAPGSAARSLTYLNDTHPGVTLPPGTTPQGLHEDLKDRMNTNPNGTTDGNMKAGKDSYAADNNVPVTTELHYGDDRFETAHTELAAGADIEVLITWKDKDGKPIGGHAAMMTSITKKLDANGNVIGYVITYVDSKQPAVWCQPAAANNQHHTIEVDAAGNFPGGEVDGFMIQKGP